MNISLKYDAIVVLGGGRTNQGELTPLSKQRLDKGIELYKEGSSDTVVVLGGPYSTYSPNAIRFKDTGARIRGQYLINNGVDPNDIMYVENGRDTILEAFASRQKLRDLGIKKIGLVTSDKHLDRSLFIFGRVFGPENQIEGISVPCGDILNVEEEAAYLEAAKRFFANFPDTIPDPNFETWFSNHAELYGEYKMIHDRFHPPGQESQAYMGVRKENR